MSQVKCPSCEKLTKWSSANPSRPFCSERCKMSDLNGWLSDEYSLGDNESAADPEQAMDQLTSRIESEPNH